MVVVRDSTDAAAQAAGAGAGAPSRQSSSFEVAPLRTVAVLLLRRPRLLLGFPLGFATLVFSYFFFFGSFVAQSSFIPQSSGAGLGGLAGLAAQFGSSLPSVLGGDASESLDFYASLLRSPALLDRVAAHQYAFRKREGDSTSTVGTLYKLYGYDDEPASDRTRLMVERLQKRVSASVNRLGNIVVLKVKAPYPELAQQINRQMLESLNEFNLQQRQTAAGAQRRFAEERVSAARTVLMATEDSMRRFLETNRIYESDPRLVVEFGRLQRRIDLAQSVFTSLSQTLEETRIEEVRNTPVITVIDRPELFSKRSRNLAVVFVGAFVFGLAVSVAAVLLLEYLTGGLATVPASDLSALARDAVRSLTLRSRIG